MTSTPAVPRFNPWPYGIILFFVFAIAGTATLVFVATSHHTELVAPDYYDQEIRFQQRLDQVKRTQVWESRITVTVDPGASRLAVHLPAEHAALSAHGRIELYRPSAAGADRSVPLALDSQGIQTLPLAGIPPGKWVVRVQWRVAADDYFVERNVVVPAPKRG